MKRGQPVYAPKDRIDRLSTPEPNTGCWLWLGPMRVNPAGIFYGRLTIGSRSDGSRRHATAHRYSYETYVGQIPAGLEVCHKCDVGLCVNPDHLFLGTHSENMKDAFKKHRIFIPAWRLYFPPSPGAAGE